MKHIRTYSKLVLVILLLIGTDAFAGAWPQKKGSGYFQLSTQIIRANEFYEPGGNKISITTLGDYTLTFYGEYGLTDNITVIGSLPFLRRLTLNRIEGENTGREFFPGDSKTGVSDFNIGAKVGIAKWGSTVLSAGLTLGIPVGDNEQKNGLYTGDGEFNQMVSVGIGHSFNGPFYFSGDVGFNNRTNGYSDEVVYNLEVGYSLSKFLFILKANGIETLRNGADAILGGAGGLFANNQKYLAFGPEIIYSINDSWGVNLGFRSGTNAENVVSAIAYQFGVFLKHF